MGSKRFDTERSEVENFVSAVPTYGTYLPTPTLSAGTSHNPAVRSHITIDNHIVNYYNITKPYLIGALNCIHVKKGCPLVRHGREFNSLRNR